VRVRLPVPVQLLLQLAGFVFAIGPVHALLDVVAVVVGGWGSGAGVALDRVVQALNVMKPGQKQ